MGGGVFEAGQQGVIGRLLLFRQGDGLVFQRDRRIQVDGFVHLAAFDDALGAEVVQHGFGDAVGLHLVLGALSPAQQGHRRQLLGRDPGVVHSSNKLTRPLCRHTNLTSFSLKT